MTNIKPIKVLLIDDDEDDYFYTKDLLNDLGPDRYQLSWMHDFEQSVEALGANAFDVYLVDYRLGSKTGIDFLQQARILNSGACIIMLTGQGSERIDLDAMKLGAADYLTKSGLSTALLERSIRYCLERKKNIDALRESEIKYRKIFEKTKDFIFVCTPKGQFIDFNDSAADLFSFTREEFMQQNFFKLFFDEREKQRFKKIMTEEGAVNDLEVTLLNKNGEKRFCLLTVSVQHQIYENETTYLGLINDLTKRKKADEALRKAEQLAAAGQFIQTIAHEVRNPLTNINLAVEELKTENDDEDKKTFLNIIQRNSERIQALVDELRESSKPASLNTNKHSINDVIDETLDIAADRIKLKDIEIIRDYSPDICKVDIDAEKVKRALLNLIINAIEAMEKNMGTIKITTRSVNEHCVITIEDNGIGIHEEDMKKLFNPFFSRKTKGIGMGLTTTQNIILSHRGNIEVESKINHGTKFSIYLPIIIQP
jgi:PAS domain S-box-containing protein